MFSLNIIISEDVFDAVIRSVHAALYGQLLSEHKTSTGQVIAKGTWVYFDGKSKEYAPVTASVDAFAIYTNQSPPVPISLPDVFIKSAHIIFGIDSLPLIPVNSSGAPQQPDPITTNSIYDFVEFTYDKTSDKKSKLTLNTTMIDQFSFPIQIQLDPTDKALPNGAGVFVDRETVFSQFQEFASGSVFLQCAQDAFGYPRSMRILSPKNVFPGNAVQGIVANTQNKNQKTLAQGNYYYTVTSTSNSKNPHKKQSYGQSEVVRIFVKENQEVVIAWSSKQSLGIATHYSIYRGTPSSNSISWANVGTTDGSGSFIDSGQAAFPIDYPINPLNTYFDYEIQKFFTNYKDPDQPLTLTATDGTINGYIYFFSGVFSPTEGDSAYLQFKLTKVVDSSGNTVNSPPIPLNTAFNVYYPYWNSNTFDSSNPSPPTWEVYTDKPASVMVLAAEGVFADNALQPLPDGVDPSTYRTLHGSLENQIVAAITRGIANSTNVKPQNWGGSTAPTQKQPTLTSGDSSLTPGTTYYYVITADNANGETYASFEFHLTPTQSQPCVQLKWKPKRTKEAKKFNIYRGTDSLQENVLVASVNNTGNTNSYTDNGSSLKTQDPPRYFPAGGSWSGYDAFFHQPTISINGAAYAGPFDDQGGKSSTIAVVSPKSATITLGPWKSTSK